MVGERRIVGMYDACLRGKGTKFSVIFGKFTQQLHNNLEISRSEKIGNLHRKHRKLYYAVQKNLVKIARDLKLLLCT